MWSSTLSYGARLFTDIAVTFSHYSNHPKEKKKTAKLSSVTNYNLRSYTKSINIMHAKDWFLVLIAFFIPPIPVFIKKGFWSSDFLINVLLFLLGFIPGLLHALYIISQNPYDERTGYQIVSGDSTYGST